MGGTIGSVAIFAALGYEDSCARVECLVYDDNVNSMRVSDMAELWCSPRVEFLY